MANKIKPTIMSKPVKQKPIPKVQSGVKKLPTPKTEIGSTSVQKPKELVVSRFSPDIGSNSLGKKQSPFINQRK